MDMATLRNIAAFAPILAAPDFVTGAWTEPRRSAEGVISMAWFNLSEPASAFVAAIATEDVSAHYRKPVDDEARAALMHMAEHPSAIADASIDQIASRVSRPRSGNCRPYSPARTPITEKPLIRGILDEIVAIRPLVNPMTSKRPSKAIARTLSSKTSPPTGS